MPVTDCTLTCICYAVNVWTLPYVNPGISFPPIQRLGNYEGSYEESEDAQTAALDALMTKICFHLDCETLSTFFKINPKKKILDIEHAIE